MYDAIIVGARCAGSPTAMLLAQKGYRVLLVDRDTFPSDTMSTHYIWQSGMSKLKSWGLMDKVLDSDSPPISKITFDIGPLALKGNAPPAEGVTQMCAPRRIVLDKILVDAAVESGAELMEGFSVQEVVVDGGRVTGIRGRSQGGSTVTEESRIVIGADGPHSIVARNVDAPSYDERPALSCCYYSYWSGVPTDGLEFYSRGSRVIFAFPTNGGLTSVVTFWPNKEFHEYRADIEGNYLKTLDLVPALGDRVRNGQREERFMGAAQITNFFRKPFGPGWALVGDAGYQKDAITAQGITDAFKHAELLAGTIDEGMSGRRPLDEAMASYEQERNESVAPIYDFTCQFLSTLEQPPAEIQQLFGALSGNQNETDRFFGTLAGTVPIPEFFSPENMQRIIGVGQT
jgi:flavin-dependent dehydrogenase